MSPYNITSYAKKILKTNKIGYIAGPNLALDLINNAPCTMCIASKDKKTISLGKHLFNKMLLDERGAGVVELVLIIVVLIGLVLVFKEQITDLINDLFEAIMEDAGKI